MISTKNFSENFQSSLNIGSGMQPFIRKHSRCHRLSIDRETLWAAHMTKIWPFSFGWNSHMRATESVLDRLKARISANNTTDEYRLPSEFTWNTPNDGEIWTRHCSREYTRGLSHCWLLEIVRSWRDRPGHLPGVSSVLFFVSTTMCAIFVFPLP